MNDLELWPTTLAAYPRSRLTPIPKMKVEGHTVQTGEHKQTHTNGQLDWQHSIVHHPGRSADNKCAKSSCAPPSQYKATLYTTKVYVGTKLHCHPWFACLLSTTKILYNASVPLWTTCVKCRGQPPLLTDIGPPCAPWCTTQVSGAQHGPVPTRWCTT